MQFLNIFRKHIKKLLSYTTVFISESSVVVVKQLTKLIFSKRVSIVRYHIFYTKTH